MFKKKNKYGVTTTPKCFFCGVLNATIKNKEGLTTCMKCKDKKQEIVCPICNMGLEIRDGKFGEYFYCYTCNKNWSKYQIDRFKRL